MLFVCFNDGKVAALLFEPGELGKLASESALSSFVSKRYGDQSVGRDIANLAETVEQLQFRLSLEGGAMTGSSSSSTRGWSRIVMWAVARSPASGTACARLRPIGSS